MVATRLVVFDLDGTLIDSRRDLAESANEMLAGYGAPPLEEPRVAGMVGAGAATLVKRVLAAAGVVAPLDEALSRFLTAYDGRLTRHTIPYAGVERLLDELESAGMMLAVLTNKPLAPSMRILEAFALTKHFRWVLGGDGTLPRKPAPDGLRFVMREAGVAPDETLLVGDSTVDLDTARNAGVRICLVRYGFGFEDVAPGQLTGAEAMADTPAAVAEALHAHR